MKPFIGNPEEKTEDRSELSKGPKEKQEVGRNHPTDTRRNRNNRRNHSSETKETKMQQKETNETVHRKPGVRVVRPNLLFCVHQRDSEGVCRSKGEGRRLSRS